MFGNKNKQESQDLQEENALVDRLAAEQEAKIKAQMAAEQATQQVTDMQQRLQAMEQQMNERLAALDKAEKAQQEALKAAEEKATAAEQQAEGFKAELKELGNKPVAEELKGGQSDGKKPELDMSNWPATKKAAAAILIAQNTLAKFGG